MDTEYCTNMNLVVDEKIADRYKTTERSGGLLTKGLKKNNNKPILSIITISYNCKLDLIKTINSVITQKYENIEYIVIDGNSTDGSAEYLESYSDKISFWLSEKDAGIYDAMNKGLSYINGDFHLFLNAGDVFVGDVITEDLLIKSPGYIDCYYKNILKRVKKIKPVYYKFRIPYNHQGIIFESKGVKYGKKYKIADDYQYYIDHEYKTMKMLNTEGFVFFDNSGINTKEYKLRDFEIAEIIRKNYGFFFHIVFKLYVNSKNIIRQLINIVKA